jgi:hemerythrin
MFALDLYGIEELDSQHQEIYVAINSLSLAVKADMAGEETHVLVMRLYELLKIHFASEESLMQTMAYPYAAEHKDTHNAMIRDMEELIEISLENGKLDGLGTSLETTFANGIFLHDQVFIKFVGTHRESLTNSV